MSGKGSLDTTVVPLDKVLVTTPVAPMAVATRLGAGRVIVTSGAATLMLGWTYVTGVATGAQAD